MTYRELYESATRKLEKSEITLGEYEEMTKPLNEDVRTWIPVSKRLPEEHKEVLTYGLGGFIEIQSIELDYWENQYCDWSDINEVVAWMPLPQPYEAERSK